MSCKIVVPALFASSLAMFATVVLAVPAEGTRIMISAPSDYAVDAGKAASAKGGNLIDVAVAVGLTLDRYQSVQCVARRRRFCTGEHGSRASKCSTSAKRRRPLPPRNFMSISKKARPGTAAPPSAFPASPQGLWALHQKYGKLEWSTLFDTAMSPGARRYRVFGTAIALFRNPERSLESRRFKPFLQDSRATLPAR